MSPIHAKTVQIFLPTGDPEDIQIAELTSRTIQVIAIPRYLLNEARHHEEINNVGLYFLFGEDEKTGRDKVYIGEAENCFSRLKQHDKEKEFWNIALVVNHKQNQFTKSDVRYLEYLAYDTARTAERFLLDQNTPTGSHVPRVREVDLLDFFSTIDVLTAALGYKVFRSKRKSNQVQPQPILPLSVSASTSTNDNLWHCSGRGVKAQGEWTKEGFLIHKGSQSSSNPTENFLVNHAYHVERQQQLIHAGILEKKGEHYVFQEDYLCKTPSMAGCMVLMRPFNGWKEWKSKDGRKLDVLRQKIIS